MKAPIYLLLSIGLFLIGTPIAQAQSVFHRHQGPGATVMYGRASATDDRTVTAFGINVSPDRRMDFGFSVGAAPEIRDENGDTPSSTTFSFSGAGWPVIQSEKDPFSLGVGLSANTITWDSDPETSGSIYALTTFLVREFKSELDPNFALYTSATYVLLYPGKDVYLKNRNTFTFDILMGVGRRQRMLIGGGLSNELNARFTSYSFTLGFAI